MFGKLVRFVLFACLLSGTAYGQLARPTVGKSFEYTAKEGDTLLSIAKAHRLAIEHLGYANGFPFTAVKIIPGSKLLIPGERVLPLNPPRTGLVLNVPERGLYRFKDGKFVEFFPVAVGNPPDAKSPVGQWSIIEKIKNPTWYPPSWAEIKKPVGPGPDNPLGDRWIGLSAHMVGIHGTNNPINVGGSVTHGCIRCFPEHVRDLFEKVRVGDPVRLDYEVVKLAKRADGSLHLVTFEDIYEKSDTAEAARKLLKKIGKDHLMEDPNFKGRVDLTMGSLIDLAEAEKIAAARRQLSSRAQTVEKVDVAPIPELPGFTQDL